MTQIKIEKKRPSGWPWLVGALIILIAGVWLLAELMEKTDNKTAYRAGNRSAQLDAGAVQTVNYFVEFVNKPASLQQMSTDHTYTGEGLLRLAEALNVLNKDNNAEIQRKIAVIRTEAMLIQQDPGASTHARAIQSAFKNAAEVMERLQQNAYPDLGAQVAQVKAAADRMDPEKLALQQKNTIETFFKKSGQALDHLTPDRMAGTPEE